MVDAPVWPKHFVASFLAGNLALASTDAMANETKAWQDSISPETKERYIPVELWAGVECDGKRELKMPKVDATYKHRSQYQIKGLMEWQHPTLGRKFLVYERLSLGRGVLQLFTINEDRSGLGRLYDARPGSSERITAGGA